MIERLQTYLPRLVLSPSFVLILLFVYGFIAFTGYLSVSDSRMLPSLGFVGLENYDKLFSLRHWSIALKKSGDLRHPLHVICTVIGLGLAILLDMKFGVRGCCGRSTSTPWRFPSS